MMSNLLVDSTYIVQKQAHKGGWHYVVISDISPDKRGDLGLIRVCGLIDTYALKQFNLLPMKDGNMFLPLKTAVRKEIGKKEGDTVHVVLYADESAVVIPDDIKVCLLESDKAFSFFLTLSGSNQKYYIDWVEEAKRLETKVERISKMIDRLEQGLKFYDWLKHD